MAKAIFVKKAQKPNAVVTQDDIDRANAGEVGAASYYWWSVKSAYSSYKRFSKTQPKASDLTQSEYWSAIYGIQEDVDGADEAFDDLESFREDVAQRVRELGEECREKFDNLPEGFQQGSTGELLEQRADSCEGAADEIEGLSVPEIDDFDGVDDILEEPDEGTTERATWDDALEEWKNEKSAEFIDEIRDILSNIEG